MVFRNAETVVTSGKEMLTCIFMQNVIKIYHVVQEVRTFSLAGTRWTDSHGDYSADPRFENSANPDRLTKKKLGGNEWIFFIGTGLKSD